MRLLNRLQSPAVQPAALILLVGLLLVVFPNFSHLPLWLSLVVTALIIWRGCYELQLCSIPGKKVLFILTIMLLSGILFSYHTLVGRNAGSAMLLGLLCLKLFEIKSYRDIFLIINISLFSIVINFLFSQSIPVAITMIFALVFLFTALISFQHDYKKLSPSVDFEAVQKNEKQHFKLALKMLSQAIPFAVVLFILFPRINGPLWGLPEDAFSATTGLSDKMSPGKISQLSDNPEIAFRVAFDSEAPDPSKLYWRGPVMWSFDGYNWSAPKAERIELDTFKFRSLGDKTDYNITLQPHNKFWMFALDIPSTLPKGTLLSADIQVLSVLPVQKLRRFKISSYTNYVLPQHPKIPFTRYLKLPPTNANTLSKSRALIAKLKHHSNPQKTVNNVLKYFSTQDFYYSRQPPLLNNNPVDEFLFETKRGYCEHYASSFTILMRLAGIPARVVTGYQGGELNPIDNYFIVRQSDAHAWSEVYLNEKGWVRVDPTAAIPPGNIENTADALRLNSSLKKPDYLFEKNWFSEQIKKTRFAWDAINNRWNQWVLGYNTKKQKAFFAAIGIEEISWQGLSQLLFGFLALLTAILAFVVFSNKTKNKTKDEVQQAYLKFLKKMKKQGLIKKEAEGSKDFAKRAIKKLPQHKTKIKSISYLYQKLRYGKLSLKGLEQLKKQISHFYLR